MKALPLLLLAGSLACVTAERDAPGSALDPDSGARRGGRTEWLAREVLLQGFFGFTAFRRVTVDGPSVDGSDGDLDVLPLIGGGAQWKLGGGRADLGLEGLLSFSGRSEADATAVDGGGTAVDVRVDLLLLELHCGPFASVRLGDELRVYGAAGPLVQLAGYEQSGAGLADSGSGLGLGLYARTGIEFVLASSTMIGLGARWSDTTVDLGGSLGDLEIEGLQVLFTVSRGL